jgi:hypothetical protein
MTSSSDDIFGGNRAPVAVTHGKPAAARPPRKPAAREEKLEKFLRRIAGLQPGRYVIVITVSATGLQDWSVQETGKVEGDNI